MAELLIETWRLSVLRVRLEVALEQPSVHSDLTVYEGDSPRRLWTRVDPLEGFGLARDRVAPSRLAVPHALVEAVADGLERRLGRQAALWLRLVPPYGYLGGVPWERELVAATDLPVLRVPDRLPVATDAGRSWTVALVVNAVEDPQWAAGHARRLAATLRDRMAAEVDLFPDAGTARHLDAAGGGPQGWLRVHDPAAAAPAGDRQDAAPRGRTRWADWIVEGLGRRAVRAFHAVSPAAFDGEQPLIALPPDPGAPGGWDRCVFVTAEDVERLADRVGAGLISFGSPPENRSDTATRVMADALGQRRPGPTVYCDAGDDPGGDALAWAHAFAADATGETPVPRAPSLFAYLQPEHVQQNLAHPWPAAAAAGPPTSPVAEEAPLPAPPAPGALASPEAGASIQRTFASEDHVPTWVAASERFVDRAVAELVKRGPAPGAGGAYDAGTAQALADLRDLVARHATGAP
ncbi:hypothetical protein [Miltoncostaea marina]|uniref:hypothetical protein n=1 Tax=Miltoncostaea marina TaxID=2843215 RepID=UPI001C3E8230|nr:hypothetical protein [Miltoncostaea marina]